MGDSRSSIADDEESYLALCKKFNEMPDPSGPYCSHAQLLERLSEMESTARKALADAEAKSLKTLSLYKQAKAKLSDEEFEALRTLLSR